MKARFPSAILCLILANSLTFSAPTSSGERVHIRLHMPEIVRKHTHFHKVYKVLPPAIEAPMPHQLLHPSAASSYGKPHVSLLGYTTTASGSGVLSPNLMQVMASAATPMAMMPTLTPNYGPALFDNYNQEATSAAATTAATLPTIASGSGNSKSPQQQLLQQIFTPNILAAISASQQQKQKPKKKLNNFEMEVEPEAELESEPESELEDNELLNNNFLDAIQHEYFNKFGSGTRKRKKVHFRSNYRRPPPKKTSNYVQESEEQFEEYPEEQSTGYDDESPPSSYGNDDDEATGYDSAAAFSGQSNGLSLMPTVDEFLSDTNSNSYAPFYGNMYDDYGPNSGTSSRHIDHTDWHSSPPTFASYSRPTKATPPKIRLRSRRPSTEFLSDTGKAGKVRYVKLTTRKKRKNRIKSKRYRI